MADQQRGDLPVRQVTVSPSQLDAMGCRLSWHWGYRKGYRARIRNLNLWFGDGIHQALEAYYDPNRQEDLVEAFEAWADKALEDADPSQLHEMEDLRTLGLTMLRGYLKEYPKDDFDVIATEQWLRQPLPDPETGEPSDLLLVSRLDGLVRDHRTGRLFSLEHKTYSRLDEAQMGRDHQMSSQVWLGQFVAEQMGLEDEEVVGVIYNGLRKAMPGPRTTVPLFHRKPVFRTRRHLEVFLHRAYHQANEARQPDFPIFPQPNPMKCGWCEFKEPCLEYMNGGDYQGILDATFSSREDRDREAAAKKEKHAKSQAKKPRKRAVAVRRATGG